MPDEGSFFQVLPGLLQHLPCIHNDGAAPGYRLQLQLSIRIQNHIIIIKREMFSPGSAHSGKRTRQQPED